jgi:hypothetical protein
MAFIATVRPRDAAGETREVYRYMAAVGGQSMVARIVQLFSLRPGSMRRMIRSWELAMWMGDGPRAMRETAAAAVSRFNDCHY